MNRLQIRNELARIIQDPTYTTDRLDFYIYQAVLQTAGLVALPDMKRVGSVNTELGQPYVTLTGFSGRLSRVHKPDIRIFPSLDLLIDAYSDIDNESLDTEGDVEAVALEGKNLWYQYVPAVSETLVITYYIDPPAFTSDADEPSYIPSYLHYQLLVNGAAYIIYDQIEDGEDDPKVNTARNFNKSFNLDDKHSGIVELQCWISRNRIPYISSVWSE